MLSTTPLCDRFRTAPHPAYQQRSDYLKHDLLLRALTKQNHAKQVHCLDLSNNNNNNNNLSIDNDFTNEQHNSKDVPISSHLGHPVLKHMSSNGIDKNKMTGSSNTGQDKFPWLSEVDVTKPSSTCPEPVRLPITPGRTSEAMLSASSQELGIFRTPSEPSQRLFAANIGPYNTTASSISPYSSGLRSQTAGHVPCLSPYGAAVFYPQYGSASYSPAAAAAAAAGSMISGPFPPPMDSYSAVLASMGGHVQHAQSSLPRSSFLSSHLPQYIGHRPITSSSSAPSQRQTMVPPGTIDPFGREGKSPKSDQQKEHDVRIRQDITSPPGPHPRRYPVHEQSKVPGIMKDHSVFIPPREGPSLKHRLSPRDDKSRGPIFKRFKSSVKSEVGSGAHSDLPPPPPLQPTSSKPPPHYPPHFMKGSIIQLANGELKRVEDLRTEDFVGSADLSDDLKIDSSTVVRIEERDDSTVILGFSVGENRVQVTVEAMVEHPFFVFGQGWSSCQPTRTLQRYGLTCHPLSVGDVCISLTHKDVDTRGVSDKQTEASKPTPVHHMERSVSHDPTKQQASSAPAVFPGSSEIMSTEQDRHRRWSAPGPVDLQARRSPGDSTSETSKTCKNNTVGANSSEVISDSKQLVTGDTEVLSPGKDPSPSLVMSTVMSSGMDSSSTPVRLLDTSSTSTSTSSHMLTATTTKSSDSPAT